MMEWQPIDTAPRKSRGQIIYPLVDRLDRLSKLNESTGCIEWQSSKRNGYGYLMIGSRSDNTRRTVRAHRLSYELYHGEIKDDLYVCHHCDNRACINPFHLFLGTHMDNMDDRDRKGRNIPPSKRFNPNTKE